MIQLFDIELLHTIAMLLIIALEYFFIIFFNTTYNANVRV